MPIAASTAKATAPARSVDAVVVVATFRRPAGLAETLASLAAQVTATPFAVVVVENDADGRLGLDVAGAAFDAGDVNGFAVVEAKQGHVHAVNAGFAAALAQYPDAEYFLMIDDDELASPQWLARLVCAAEANGADIVGGPVIPRFQDGVPRYLTGHPVFWPIDAKTGPLPMIYGSGNCLMRRRVFATLGAPAFDPQFNFLGGGDTDFFTRAKLAGLSSYWVADALVTETVPIGRTRAKWVVQRSLRIGAINRRLDRKRHASAPGAMRVALKDMAILCLAPARVLRELVRTGNPFTSLHPLVVSLGRLTSALGFEVEQYKSSK